METRIIDLPTCKVMFLCLPEGAENVRIDCGALMYNALGAEFGGQLMILDGSFSNWLPLGFAADVTEEQAGEIVPKSPFKTFMDFMASKGTNRVYNFRTALSSFHSLIEANGYFLRNPYGDEPVEEDYFNFMIKDFVLEDQQVKYSDDCNNWESAQERSNPYILIEKKS